MQSEVAVEPVQAPPPVAGLRPLSPVAAMTIEVPVASEEDAVEEVKVVAEPAGKETAGAESVAMDASSDLYVGDDDFEDDFEEDLELP